MNIKKVEMRDLLGRVCVVAREESELCRLVCGSLVGGHVGCIDGRLVFDLGMGGGGGRGGISRVIDKTVKH